jgi:hypothetical protein
MSTSIQSWKYRKSHLITAGSGCGTNYQIRVHVYYGSGSDSGEDVYCNSKCNTDFSDIRFTSSNGKTLIYYWLQSKTDNNNAIFYVKVSENLDSNATIYVYYGNSPATSISDENNTFVDVIPNLVGSWNMEEANATDPVLDSSGNGKNGTATGTTIVNGKFVGKKARQTNGTTDKIVISSPPNLGVNWFYYMWIKPVNYAPTDRATIFHNLGTLATIVPRITNTGIIQTVTTDSTLDRLDNNGVAVISKTVWTCLFLERDYTVNHNFTFYINNSIDKQISDTRVGTFDVTTENDIAQGVGGFEWYNGNIGNLMSFNFVPTSTQKTNLYENYPDTTLENGKVLIRKLATTTEPVHSTWGSEEENQFRDMTIQGNMVLR